MLDRNSLVLNRMLLVLNRVVWMRVLDGDSLVLDRNCLGWS